MMQINSTTKLLRIPVLMSPRSLTTVPNAAANRKLDWLITYYDSAHYCYSHRTVAMTGSMHIAAAMSMGEELIRPAQVMQPAE